MHYTPLAGETANPLPKNLNSCFDRANLELSYLATKNEPDEFQILAGSYAPVPRYIIDNAAECIADFRSRYSIEPAVDSSDFREWFLRTFTQSRISLPDLEAADVCGLALHLCDVFRTVTSQAIDVEIACSWAIGLFRDSRIDPLKRLDAIAETVTRSLSGDRSEYLSAALRLIRGSDLSVIVALHLDAMQRAHSGQFQFACSMPIALAERLWNRKFHKAQVSRVLSHFEAVGLIEYLDRGCNDRDARRPATILTHTVESAWPVSTATDAIFSDLSASIIEAVLPRKLYTREDFSSPSGQSDVRALKEACKGNWKEILISAGLSENQTRKTKSTCPFCGADKQWRLGDRDGNGSGVCDKCSPVGLGDGFKVLQKLKDWSFIESLDFVCRYLDGEQIVIEQPTVTTARKTPSPKQDDQNVPDEASYQRVLREWCSLK